MITSTSNAQIKELAKLQKKSRLRDERRIFLVEGPRMVEEVPKERIERLYISESFERKNPAYIRELGVPAEVLSDTVFSYVSDTKNPQGILAIVKRLEYTMEDILGKSASKCEEKSGEKEKNPQNHQIRVPHVIVLDNLQDPGNLGTIFRTAEAAGATGILLSSDSGCLQSQGDPFDHVSCLQDAVFLCKRSSGSSEKSEQSGNQNVCGTSERKKCL